MSVSIVPTEPACVAGDVRWEKTEDSLSLKREL